MKFSTSVLLFGLGYCEGAFVPHGSFTSKSRVVMHGYLDDLSAELNAPEVEQYDPVADSREANTMDKSKVSQAAPGSFEDFVEFNEFDGGDGQMGVAGDGQKGLESIGSQPTLAKSMATSKMMSAKNAWGTSTGYADKLREEGGVDTARAQQLENWSNQREVFKKNKAVQEMVDASRNDSAEQDWRTLAKFGVERNEDFDLDEEFGPVVAGDTEEGVIELHSRINAAATFSMGMKNEYMGFADFRAAMTPETSMDWTVTPNEGSLSKDMTEFVVTYRPTNPGGSDGFLVIQTEDFKKTFKLVGSTA